MNVKMNPSYSKYGFTLETFQHLNSEARGPVTTLSRFRQMPQTSLKGKVLATTGN
jgi:hypothetical protein